MDLFALVARLTLDTDGYSEALSAAEADFADFAARLEAGLNSAQALGAATVAAVESCARIGDAAGDMEEGFLPAVEAAMEGITAWVPTLEAVGAAMMAALSGGIESDIPDAEAALAHVGTAIEAALTSPASSARDWGFDLMDSFISGIEAQAPALQTTVGAIAQTVHDYLHFSEPDVGPLADFHTYGPDMMALFAEGIRDNAHLVTAQVEHAFDLRPGLTQAVTPVGGELVVPRSGSERPINIVFELDGAQQWVYRLNKAEEQRVGLRLAGGGA